MDRSANIPIGEKVTIEEVKSQNQKEQAFQVRKVVFVEEQQVPIELELDEFDNSAETVHFVGYIQNEPIAASRLRPYAPEIGKVERVAVLASTRGMGIGMYLMKVMEEKAKSLGFKQLKLNAQIHAEPFYKGLGYVSYGDTFLDAGIEHVAMKKSLD